MRAIGFISEKSKQDPILEDQILIKTLREFDIDVKLIFWDDFESEVYQKLDLAIFRTPWNYHLKLPEFKKWMTKLTDFKVPLHNPLTTIEWNLNKLYLRDLATRGVPIVKTEFFSAGTVPTFDLSLADEWILKPAISASAARTFRLSPDQVLPQILENIFEPNETLMLQPFMNSVITDGEFSFVYFNGLFSHAVVKRAKTDDFRVQNEHGGTWVPFTPSQQDLERSAFVLSVLKETPLYARIDMIRDGQDLLLMELELFEPMLYIFAETQAQSFAQAVVSRLSLR
jgi:hypothetical protein